MGTALGTRLLPLRAGKRFQRTQADAVLSRLPHLCEARNALSARQRRGPTPARCSGRALVVGPALARRIHAK